MENKKERKSFSEEEYITLYNQASELENRYKKLLEAYNVLLDLYLSSK